MTRGSISPCNTVGLISNVSEAVATQIAKNYSHRHGSIFIRLAVVASQKCELAQNSVKTCTYSSSRSSKVIDFGSNRKRICDFLLVINSNYGPILHRFWDTGTYWLKIAYFSYPLSFSDSLCSLWNFEVKLTVRKLESWSYLWWKLHDPNFNRFWLIHPCDWRTDGQTGDRIQLLKALKSIALNETPSQSYAVSPSTSADCNRLRGKLMKPFSEETRTIYVESSTTIWSRNNMASKKVTVN